MAFYKSFPQKEEAILLKCFHAGVYGPFFRGLIWKKNSLASHVGPDFPQLEVIARSWPDIDSKPFYDLFLSTENYPRNPTPFKVTSICLSAFGGVNYWVLEKMKSEAVGVTSHLAQHWKDWVDTSTSDVEQSLELWRSQYRDWLKSHQDEGI